MPALVGGPGPSALRGITKNRWMMLTQKPVEGHYLLIYFDGISTESLANKAEVPVHPIEQSSSVSDHSLKGAQAYSVFAFLGTPLQGDNVAPRRNNAIFNAAYSDLPVLISPPEAVTQGIANQPIFNDRGASLLFALDRILGIPVDIFSPRYGKLRSFVLTSYNDKRDGSSRIDVDLSFQEIRRPVVETVVVEKVPRARNQTNPARAGSASTVTDDATSGLSGDRSNLFDIFVRDGGRVDPNNPNSPPRAQRLGELVQSVPETLAGGVWQGVTGTN